MAKIAESLVYVVAQRVLSGLSSGRGGFSGLVFVFQFSTWAAYPSSFLSIVLQPFSLRLSSLTGGHCPFDAGPYGGLLIGLLSPIFYLLLLWFVYAVHVALKAIVTSKWVIPTEPSIVSYRLSWYIVKTCDRDAYERAAFLLSQNVYMLVVEAVFRCESFKLVSVISCTDGCAVSWAANRV
jgi:hypothetical protein